MPVPYSAALATFDEEKRKRGIPTEPAYRLRGQQCPSCGEPRQHYRDGACEQCWNENMEDGR